MIIHGIQEGARGRLRICQDRSAGLQYMEAEAPDQLDAMAAEANRAGDHQDPGPRPRKRSQSPPTSGIRRATSPGALTFNRGKHWWRRRQQAPRHERNDRSLWATMRGVPGIPTSPGGPLRKRDTSVAVRPWPDGLGSNPISRTCTGVGMVHTAPVPGAPVKAGAPSIASVGAPCRRQFLRSGFRKRGRCARSPAASSATTASAGRSAAARAPPANAPNLRRGCRP